MKTSPSLKILIRGYLLCLALPALLSSCGSHPDASLAPHREGEVLVQYKDKAAAATLAKTLKAVVADTLPSHRVQRLLLPKGMSVSDALQKFGVDPSIEFAEPNYTVGKAGLPNDPLYPKQWGLSKIGMEQVWDLPPSGQRIIVAVLDTGVDYGHEDLLGNMWSNPNEVPGNGLDDDQNGIVDDYHGANFYSSRQLAPVTGDPQDDDTESAHGTHVAGVISATTNNGTGVAGIASQARIMAVKFLHEKGYDGSVFDAAKGMDYAVSNGAKIVNCSFELPGYSLTLEQAMKRADARGALVISAAGNGGADCDRFDVTPATIRSPNAISVAATDSSDGMPSYSNRGATKIDVAAPGGVGFDYGTAILSTVMPGTDYFGNNSYDSESGTSMAAPFVSGLAALVWSAYPELTHYQVKARILNGVDKLPALAGRILTGGRINAFSSLTVRDIPTIFSVSRKTGTVGDLITITGVNFGAARGTVSFNGGTFTVASWQDTQITCNVTGPAASAEITIDGSGGFPFHVLELDKTFSVALKASPESGAAPLAVVFESTITGSAVAPLSYQWDTGGGTFVSFVDAKETLRKEFGSLGIYTVRVRVTDDAGRTATGEIAINVAEAAVAASGSSGGCFIATAAYGSYLHPKVQVLRAFRDRYLLTNAPGRVLVAVYYRLSPPSADIIARVPCLRALCRILLAPLVFAFEHVAPVFCGGMLLFALCTGRRFRAGAGAKTSGAVGRRRRARRG